MFNLFSKEEKKEDRKKEKYAGASKALVLDDRHLGSIRRRATCSAHPPTASTNHQEVKDFLCNGCHDSDFQKKEEKETKKTRS